MSDRRIIDPDAVRSAGLEFDECAACGGPQSNVHHILQKAAPHFGDDVRSNLVGICGSGTMGCHGAFHGSPYIYVRHYGKRRIVQRRDAEWVARRIGQHLIEQRPDVLAYVLEKLGDEQGREHLRRFYYVDLAR